MRVAIIPARGGSVRIPRKNVRDFRGRPMLHYPISAAYASCLFDSIVVSTDSQYIADHARWAGASVHMREPDDGSRGTQEVAAEVLRAHGRADEACVIYPCSPLLEPGDLIRARAQMSDFGCRYAMSVGPDDVDAGCFYFGDARAFLDGLPLETRLTLRYPLPAERVCDINTPEDWARAESMFDTLTAALRRAT